MGRFLLNSCGAAQDPKMQEMLYPYLPEGMRNPQTFEWMLSNPEYRQQLEQMLEAQVCLCDSFELVFTWAALAQHVINQV